VERIADIVQAPPDSTAGKAASDYRNRYQSAVDAAETDRYPSI